MTTDIFIRSYSGDFQWLAYALKSLNMRAKGFRDIHIVVPSGQAHLLSHLTLEKVHECPVYSDDYLGQQITKMMADTYTDADFIMHFDSDTVLTADVTPDTFIVDGKPINYYEPYTKLDDCPWRPIVTDVLGWEPEYEFMRRHPFVYPRSIYHKLRGYLTEKYFISFEQYVMNRQYRSFSEFNVLGAYAWRYYKDLFDWRDPHNNPTYVKQFWSWGGINHNIQELEELLQ
jgi:hypothetical protein